MINFFKLKNSTGSVISEIFHCIQKKNNMSIFFLKLRESMVVGHALKGGFDTTFPKPIVFKTRTIMPIYF